MRTPVEAVDIEPLLAPISESEPSGTALRYDGIYERIHEARRAEDESLPQGVWRTRVKRADWDTVAGLCMDTLRLRSKDLQLAAYLTESWLHLYGVLGAAAGLRLMAELCQRFWPTLHPRLDLAQDESAGRTSRLSPFEWLDARVPIVIKLLPLTAPPRGRPRGYCYFDWEVARGSTGLERMIAETVSGSDGRERPTVEERPSGEQILHALNLTAPVAVSAIAEQLGRLERALQEVETALATHWPTPTPIMNKIHKTLDQVGSFLRPVSELAPAEPAAESASYAAGRPQHRSHGDALHTPFITSRSQAYQQLDAIADFLLRSEPHSPTPYLLKRAVRWGGLSLSQLLAELVQGDRDLQDIYALLGLPGRRTLREEE